VNRRTLAGVAMIIGTSASIQVAAAIAHSLFDTLTPTGVSALRFALGTAIVLPVVRPSVRGRDRETWIAIAVYGSRSGS
jgi:inner membrane transporter RhtA